MSNTRYDVAIWGVINTRAAVTIRRVAEACVQAGLKTVLVWWEYHGPSGRTPADYPIEGLDFHKFEIRKDFGPLRYPHPAAMPLLQRGVQRALSQLAPRCLVTQLDHTLVDRVLQYSARRAGIPGVALQEGMANVPKYPIRSGADARRWRERWGDQRLPFRLLRSLPHPLLDACAPYTFAEYALVWGETMRRLLLSLGRSEHTTIVTGSPLFDHISGQRALADIRRRTMLYVHQPMNETTARKHEHYEQVMRAVVKDLGCRLIFKLHPGQEAEAGGIRTLAARIGCPEALFEVVDRGNAVDMLDRASVVTVASSTTAYHAAVAGVPLVVLDHLLDNVRFDVGDSGGAAVVRTDGEMRAAFERALHDDAFRQQLHRGAGRMLADHLHALDGRSAERVARFLGQVAAGRGAGTGRSPRAGVRA